jgi:hypothetical protein
MTSYRYCYVLWGSVGAVCSTAIGRDGPPVVLLYYYIIILLYYIIELSSISATLIYRLSIFLSIYLA